MITELRNQYENNVAKLKDDIEGFIQNNKPQLTEAEDKLACLMKNFGEEKSYDLP